MRRSPLKDQPLRVAGQSVDEAMRKVLDDDVTDAAAIVAIALGLACYEWFRAWTSAPPRRIAVSVCAAIVIAWGISKIARSRKKLRTLRQGRDGERIVAEKLEDLRRRGF